MSRIAESPQVQTPGKAEPCDKSSTVPCGADNTESSMPFTGQQMHM
ncbi:hypothetical protein [Pantoea stewartii]|nr:hypothetical protein [Pantoea stewartii]